MGLMYFFFKNFFGGPQKPVPREEMFAPKFERGLPLDMNVYLSEQPEFRSVLNRLASAQELLRRISDRLLLATST